MAEAICTNCEKPFPLTYWRKYDMKRRGREGFFCCRSCYLEWERANATATARDKTRKAAARREEYNARRRAEAAAAKSGTPAVTTKRSTAGLGPDEPLIPPAKCAGLPGRPCENRTRNRRCESCKAEWDRMHGVGGGRYSGDEYGANWQTAPGGKRL